MNIQELKTLIDYNYWARNRMLDALEPLSVEQFTREVGGSFRSIRDTVVHVYWAEWIWLRRWQGESSAVTMASESFPDVAAIRKAWTEHESKLRSFFDGLDEDGVHRSLSYRTMAGQEMASPLWQMLQHVVNHGTYHRGQVTTLLRQIGATPPKSMDLIAFYRELGAQT